MKRCELTVLDEWANLILTGESSGLLIVVAFVIEQNVDLFGISFDQRGSNPDIAFLS